MAEMNKYQEALNAVKNNVPIMQKHFDTLQELIDKHEFSLAVSKKLARDNKVLMRENTKLYATVKRMMPDNEFDEFLIDMIEEGKLVGNE